MRARNTKPGFYSNPVLIDLPADHRLLFLGLGALCDRRGLVEDRPRKIKDAVLRGLDTDVDAALNVLASAVDDDGTTLISRYVGANGVRVVKVNKFLQHNKPHCKEPENPTLCDTDGTAGVVLDRYPASTGPALGQPRAGTGLAQGQHALNPESCILNPESCIPLPESARPGQAPGASGALPGQDSGDPGDGTLDPVADSAAVMALMASTAAATDLDRAGARRSPSAGTATAEAPTHGLATETRAGRKPGALPAAKAAASGPPSGPLNPGAPITVQSPDADPARAAAYQLAEYLHEIDPAITAPPIIDNWAMPIARLHHRDKREWQEIASVMHWAFKVSDWWPPRLLNPHSFCRHYAQLRAQWQAEQVAAEKGGQPKDESVSAESLRSLYAALEYELSDSGPDDARAWIERQKPALHKCLTARLDKLIADQGAD